MSSTNGASARAPAPTAPSYPAPTTAELSSVASALRGFVAGFAGGRTWPGFKEDLARLLLGVPEDAPGWIVKGPVPRTYALQRFYTWRVCRGIDDGTTRHLGELLRHLGRLMVRLDRYTESELIDMSGRIRELARLVGPTLDGVSAESTNIPEGTATQQEAWRILWDSREPLDHKGLCKKMRRGNGHLSTGHVKDEVAPWLKEHGWTYRRVRGSTWGWFRPPD